MKRILISFALLLSSITLTPMAAAQIILDSDPGDWIGGGSDTELSEPFILNISESLINISHSSGFSFEFVPPDNRDLARGVYLDAERAPFRGPLNPGMEISSSGRGCNQISGEFYIYELDTSVQPPALAMDFVQYCDSTVSALRGNIRINTDIAAPYPLPLATVTTSNKAPREGENIVLSASFSVVNNSPFTVAWEQTAGPVVTIISPNEATIDITLPENLDLGGEELAFAATVTDIGGNTDTAQLTVHVASKSDPQTFLTFDSEAGDYIGQGRSWYYSPSNTSITMSQNFGNGVSVNIDGSEFWTVDFAAPDSAQLEVGVYDLAERFPFQSPGIAGLSLSGDGRGCNQSFGSFEVTQIERNSNNPTALRATFEQFCESLSAPRLWGEVAVNAVDPSVPTANAGLDVEVSEGSVVNLNGSESFDAGGAISGFSWSTSNSSVAINNSTESRTSFIAPTLGNRVQSEVIDVQLDVVDDEGFKARDTVSVTVVQNNADPVANSDNVEANVGETTEINVLVNDQDVDGELQVDSITIVQEPTLGSITIRSSGVLEYSSTSVEPGNDSFSYKVRDNDGAESNEAQVMVSIVTPTPTPTSSGGGGSTSWLLLVMLGILTLRGKRRQ